MASKSLGQSPVAIDPDEEAFDDPSSRQDDEADRICEFCGIARPSLRRRRLTGASAGVLDGVFAVNPEARGYVLDDQSTLRKHIAIFVDGDVVSDCLHLSDAVSETSSIYILQARSGG